MDTLPIKPERMEALKKYAHQLGKDPADVLDDALAKFLDYETWFARATEEGIDAADRGELIEHEDLGKLIEGRYSG